MADNLQEMSVNSDERVDRMLELVRDAKVDHNALDDLRSEIKKWVTCLKPDVLAQYALHMVGDGQQFIYDLQQKIGRAGDELEGDIRAELEKRIAEIDLRISQIASLSLKSERHSRTAEELRDEVKKWLDDAQPATLFHFASHHIGTGTVFCKYVQEMNQ